MSPTPGVVPRLKAMYLVTLDPGNSPPTMKRKKVEREREGEGLDRVIEG